MTSGSQRPLEQDRRSGCRHRLKSQNKVRNISIDSNTFYFVFCSSFWKAFFSKNGMEHSRRGEPSGLVRSCQHRFCCFLPSLSYLLDSLPDTQSHMVFLVVLGLLDPSLGWPHITVCPGQGQCVSVPSVFSTASLFTFRCLPLWDYSFVQPALTDLSRKDYRNSMLTPQKSLCPS